MGRGPPPAPAVVPGGRRPSGSEREPVGTSWNTSALENDLRSQASWALHRGARRGLARARPGTFTDPLAATRLALRCLARRVRDLEGEIALLEADLDPLTAKAPARSLRRLHAPLGGPN